jgi:segregation and condensation protein A
MTRSLADNAIDLLLDLAERGEINPWDVQVIEVIDRFLSKLRPEPTQAVGRAPYEAELSESGQAFLYASMLLLLKADTLARLEAQAQADQLDDLADSFEVGELGPTPLPPNLERRIRRRAAVPPVENRRVTLQELITQLNLIAAEMADPKVRRALVRRPRPQPRSQAIRAIAELAHQENLSEIAAVLEQFLLDHWEILSQHQEWIDFELLLGHWASSQPQDTESTDSPKNRRRKDSPKPEVSAISDEQRKLASVHDRVGVFWALLFLSAQSKVELAQETFYQDLKIRSLAEPVTSTDQVNLALID